MRALLVVACGRIALSAPLRWAYRWHRRVAFASAASMLDGIPLSWLDVNPFPRGDRAEMIERALDETSSAEIFRPGPTFPPIESGMVPLDGRRRQLADVPLGDTQEEPRHRMRLVEPERR